MAKRSVINRILDEKIRAAHPKDRSLIQRYQKMIATRRAVLGKIPQNWLYIVFFNELKEHLAKLYLQDPALKSYLHHYLKRNLGLYTLVKHK